MFVPESATWQQTFFTPNGASPNSTGPGLPVARAAYPDNSILYLTIWANSWAEIVASYPPIGGHQINRETGRTADGAPSRSRAGYSHPSKSEHPLERYPMNTSHTRTGRIFERLVAVWQDTRYASQRLTAINRPWIAQRASARTN